MLGIKEEYYDLEMFYSEEEKARIIRIKLKYDLIMKFETESFEKSIQLYAKDAILLLRILHMSFDDTVSKLSNLGMDIILATTSSVDHDVLTMFLRNKA